MQTENRENYTTRPKMYYANCKMIVFGCKKSRLNPCDFMGGFFSKWIMRACMGSFYFGSSKPQKYPETPTFMLPRMAAHPSLMFCEKTLQSGPFILRASK